MRPTSVSASAGLESGNSIQGSGEMADRIRQFDWSATPLGPISAWSETLVAVVNMMLSSPFPFAFYWGPDYIVLYNDHYCPFLSAKHPESLGNKAGKVWEEIWPILGKAIDNAFHQAQNTREHRAYIPILIDGLLQDRWWTYGISPIFEAGTVVGVANPVTEDTATVLAEQALRKSEEEFQLGMDSAELGMWQYDPATDVVTADSRMQQIFGSSTPNGIVKYWLDLLHPDDRELVATQFAGALAGKNVYDIEYRMLRSQPEGEEIRWVRSKGQVIGPKRHPERMFAIVEDITEQKKARAALHQSEKLAAVGRLAASIAHEINNPLESVTNLLYLIRGSEDLPEIQNYVETAERELRRVSLITNQTLRFHRQSTRSSPAFCFDLIGDSMSMFQGRLVNNHIQVEKRKRAEHPVECLNGEIRQVLNNLISNAIDAMPSGGRLLLRSRETTNPHTGCRGLVITVADNGTGMKPETRKRLFEAFYTTKGIGGTGLGLWISKDIVARHDGQLLFRSSDRPGKSGSVFTLFLPFKEDPDTSPALL